MRFIVADLRETVVLSVPRERKLEGAVGGLTIVGRFKPRNRILELTDAQAALFQPALVALCESKPKALYAPAGWPAPVAEEPADAEIELEPDKD